MKNNEPVLHTDVHLKVPWHENVTLRLFNINMSSPSLPLVPQWLEMSIGVNQALGIFLRL